MTLTWRKGSFAAPANLMTAQDFLRGGETVFP